jgi:phospholipase/carboxylesterase
MYDAVERAFTARLDCHFLLRRPDVVDARTPLVVALHGFGAGPEVMLALTARLFSEPPVIASLQGPYQFFREASTRDVGYGWITSRRPAESIRLHHDMVSHVLDAVGRECGIPPPRRLLVGFSQSVSLNYRFAATCPSAVRGVIAICGGLPGDWEHGNWKPVTAAVLHIARRQDEHYPPEVTEHYPDRLRLRAADVEFHLIEGGHHVPSSGAAIVDPWLHRILPGAQHRGATSSL